MSFPRSSGVLLHPTSLPSGFGIGDLGPEAYKFVDLLASAKQSLWQLMPLGPTSFGDSPYQCLSSCAGNTMLVSPQKLISDGLLLQDWVGEVPQFPGDRVDYGPVIEWKSRLLWKAFEFFKHRGSNWLSERFEKFCADNAYWLDDYALFKALKDHHEGAEWSKWPHDVATHQPGAVAQWRERLGEQIRAQKYFQFLFGYQWRELKSYANERGLKIIGDIPIFVAYDSADVWSNPTLFWLDADGKPLYVAGVPPDYFSETGQLWGNPLYRWEAMSAQKYRWWMVRFRAALTLVDILRIDHFRGFEGCWEVPAAETTAVNGRWVKVPGQDLFEVLQETMGSLPIIAEDLGVITPRVRALRDQFKFPGMKILQFAFGDDATNAYLPHNFTPNSVVYTGTHDNDTTRGWFDSAAPHERDYVQRYLGRDPRDIVWELIRAAFQSVACMAIVPMQDLLDLGTEARMNRPSVAAGNWSWRFTWNQLGDHIPARLRELTLLYNRSPL
ncbi:MAG: 4-alpha-glucanotransferase [Candidatus Riflebacteria bacterium]|nr:4-alpha-glucanotransferase [Candidatus Riflebacteria bacterium]